MKTKWIWIGISVLVLVGLLVGSLGCAPAAPTGTPGAAPTVTVTATPPAPPRVDPAPKGSWDNMGYYPVSMEGKKIDIMYLMLAHPVSMNWKKGMEDENEKYGFELSHFDTNFSSELNSDFVDASIGREVDLIVVSPGDPASGAPPIERAHAANIPVLMFLNYSDYLPDITVTVDSYAQGVQISEYLAKALDYEGKVGVFMGDFVATTGIARRQGFLDVMDKYPGLEVVANADTPTGPWSREGGYDTMKGILAATPDIDGIFAGDDNMAMGASLAIKEAGKSGEIVLVGLGGERSGLEAIKDGSLTATSWYSPYTMGRDIIEAAVYILSSPGYKVGTLQGIKWTDIIPVDISNVDDVLWPPAG